MLSHAPAGRPAAPRPADPKCRKGPGAGAYRSADGDRIADQSNWLQRRQMLLCGGSAVPLLLLQADNALARQRPGLGVESQQCALEELTTESATECRLKILREDQDAAGSADYKALAKENQTQAAGVGTATGAADAEYVEMTTALADYIGQWASLDVYDPARLTALAAIKSDGPKWVSKYARGGSVKNQSARRFYIALDAALGHIAPNG
ncbi:unnamed protein product [Ostreobium quekettii]|uniref:Uncharacterized protein n=1 Tax=Ostreobium quekettii TaxID=121088 RepID=A0A8S1IKM6_9CHLO|nr:unnamed protein product [Ostreobium quekettii]CAD7701018.1 unnamed protein product [Ostreobium quekettii]